MYTYSELTSMRNEKEWKNCMLIYKNNRDNKDDTNYNLHATGDADMNGRIYVAIPKSKKLTPETKKKYNIL